MLHSIAVGRQVYSCVTFRVYVVVCVRPDRVKLRSLDDPKVVKWFHPSILKRDFTEFSSQPIYVQGVLL